VKKWKTGGDSGSCTWGGLLVVIFGPGFGDVNGIVDIGTVALPGGKKMKLAGKEASSSVTL